MSYFTFEHDCSNAPLTLTIEVEYSIYNFSGNYYEPAETSVNDYTYMLLCAVIDLTKCIIQSTNEKLIAELEEAIIEAIWENEDNQ
jgi:hypothetical protein